MITDSVALFHLWLFQLVGIRIRIFFKFTTHTGKNSVIQNLFRPPTGAPARSTNHLLGLAVFDVSAEKNYTFLNLLWIGRKSRWINYYLRKVSVKRTRHVRIELSWQRLNFNGFLSNYWQQFTEERFEFTWHTHGFKNVFKHN